MIDLYGPGGLSRHRPTGLAAARYLLAVVAGMGPLCAAAQQSAQKIPPVRTTVTVLGSASPVTLGETARSVDVIDTQAHQPAFNTVEQYLRTDSSVQINARGAGGYPADISIREKLKFRTE